MYDFTKGSKGGGGHYEVPTIPIVPILIHYGFPDHELKDYPHGWFKVRCAFHGESQASASYSTELQAFNCHACSTSGDAIKIVREQEPGLSFPEALTKACEIAGIDSSGINVETERTYKVQRVSGSAVAKSLLGGGAAAGGSAPVRRRRGITL